MNEQKIHELWGHVHWLTVLDQQGSATPASRSSSAMRWLMAALLTPRRCAAAV